MTLRLNEKQLTTNKEANKIPVLTGTNLGSLDGSQLTNLNFQVPVNSKAMTYGGSPEFGSTIVDIVPNKVYHAEGLSNSAGGSYRLTQSFIDSFQDGDRVEIIVYKNVTVTLINNVTTTTKWFYNGNEITTGTTLQNNGTKAYSIVFRAFSNPFNSELILMDSGETQFTHFDNLSDCAFGSTSITPSSLPRYNGTSGKWEIAKMWANREIVITDATIMNYISYDRFFDTGIRETDGPYLRLSQSDLHLDGTWDHLAIILQASNLTIDGAIVPFTNMKLVLPNISNFWYMKQISVFLDNTEITCDIILEKSPIDNTTFIESANYTTTPQIGNITNFRLNANVPYAYRESIRFTAIGSSDFVPNLPDAPSGTKSWIMI
jgi:hypothetical protein